MVQSTTLCSQPLEVPFAQIELSSLLLSLPSTERECKLVMPVTANCKDTISWFDQFFSFFGLFLFRVCVEFWYRPIGDSFHPSDFSFPSNSFHSSFISTSGTALGLTSGYFDFSGHPINFWIVLSYPRLSKDKLLLA